MPQFLSLLLVAAMAQAPGADAGQSARLPDLAVPDSMTVPADPRPVSLVAPAPVLPRHRKADVVPANNAPAGRVAQGRPKAVEYSEWYGHRVTIHRISAYAMLPLFVSEYFVGNKLLDDRDPASWVKPTHQTLASGIFALFGVNTVTGLWNLWDARRDPTDRTRRTLHSLLMIAADAGFLYTASLAEDFEDDDGGGEDRGGADDHRTAALASIGVSTLGAALMWFWPH